MHSLPFISLLTRSARRLDPTTLGCVEPPVTWLSLATTSPLSHFADADAAAKAIASAVRATLIFFICFMESPIQNDYYI